MYCKTTRIFLFFGFSILLGFPISGQNLILNPGFENFKSCPSHITNPSILLEDISLPTSSSGDYFNKCGSNDFGIPSNFKGSQITTEGSGYVGLYFYALNNYREYVQLNTSKTLREKHSYKISIQLSLAEASSLALKNISIVLVNKKIKFPNGSALTSSRLDLHEDITFYEVKLKPNKSLANTNDWVTLTAEFEAKGFENHVIIGNFSNNANTALLEHKGSVLSSDFSYYYVDNIVLEELPRVNYEKDKIYVLERNPFEPKGYELDAEAIASIKKIFKYLKENAAVQMKITGHSDNVGKPEYNKFVSSLRARAVALYLKNLGIDDKRIVWEGVGDTRPLGNGKIKENHLSNRRVEFVMTEFRD
ncbi:Outer membrane porin [Flagellimonas maritima]|uniref:Outer membrane porin n=1 Tax=Flagellimonas maritima TaxID=1383885 RepID=A0A2Z4LQ91_9FLAO|nr:OmpA family protein [Allomuricauda aurantiaca]AWX43578.1 Outer membrane porin [Allomuricauda aurantiaca]